MFKKKKVNFEVFSKMQKQSHKLSGERERVKRVNATWSYEGKYDNEALVDGFRRLLSMIIRESDQLSTKINFIFMHWLRMDIVYAIRYSKHPFKIIDHTFTGGWLPRWRASNTNIS